MSAAANVIPTLALAALTGMLLGAAYALGVCVGVHLQRDVLPIASAAGVLVGAPCGLECGCSLLHLRPLRHTRWILAASVPVAAPLVAALGPFGTTGNEGPSVVLLPSLARFAFTGVVW